MIKVEENLKKKNMKAVRRRRGVYSYNSPPKVLQMNNQSQGRNDPQKEAFNIKPSNIRIWIHDKDIGKLTKVLLEGQGMRLRNETSNNPKVKKFLENVPHVMGHIKDIHGAVIDNDLDLLIAKTSPPVPPALISSKDANGLTALHKASGLAHTRLVEYLLSIWPNAATEEDHTGKTPLHWASSAKNNDRCFNLLVQAGGDELAVDSKNRSPLFYKTKPNEIDRSLLTVMPEAARISQQGLPPHFDWNMLGELDCKTMNNPVRRIDQFFTPNNLVAADIEKKLPKKNPEPTPIVDEMEKKVDSGFENSPASNFTSNGSNRTRQQIEEEAVLAAIDKIGDKNVYQKTPFASRHNSKKSLLEEDDTTKDPEVEIPDVVGYTNGYLTESKDEERATNVDLNTEVEENLQLDESLASIDRDYEIASRKYKEHDETTDREELESPIKVSQHRESFVEPVTALASDDLDKHAYPKAEPDETEEEIGERVRSAASVQEGSPIKVGKHRESTIEPVTALASDGLDKHAKPEHEHDKTEDAAEEPVKSAASGREVQRSGQSASSSSHHLEKPMSSEPRDEPLDSPDDDVVIGILGSEVEDEHNADVYRKDPHEIVESPSTVLEIKGTVEGEPDNNQLESQGGDLHMHKEADSKIMSIIETGDMEQLAVIVLNGEGDKLIGLTSQSPEIQAFLNNVPIYMNKIRKVHIASREGSLRDLQSALDRRKFAIARDEISPHKATPLHVATIFGHSGIVRYLGGRFPETTSAVDENGRTPLHYAATIDDNGHFYNLLMHLGSNPKVEDNNGHTAEFFTNHEESDKVLSHKQLLRDYGAEEELADEMLSDQEFNSNQVEIPLFRTEEGRYLATTLGDPLIKGLTEVATARPADPIAFLANYLYNFTNQPKPRTSQTSSRSITKSVAEVEPQPQQVPLQKMEAMARPEVPVTKKPQFNDNAGDDSADESSANSSAPSSEDRDEHGQSMLHFACARSHGKNALYQLIEETGTSITYRDELYRTARDVSLQATQPDNAKEIDRYVLNLAARGHYDIFGSMLLDGYDHIVDVVDADGTGITEVARTRGHTELAQFLSTIRDFEEQRENLFTLIRSGNTEMVKEFLEGPDGTKLVRAKNYYGRTALHVAVLTQQIDIVEFLAGNYRVSLRLGDNLERTPLHYAMGVPNVEALSRILIKNGAKRVLKDLKGRQPSYYFMNKADILRLQEEEHD